MSGINKNIIFYSTYPSDTLSQQCIAEINKNEEFNKQFIRVCVHHPQNMSMPALIRLPNIIQKLKEMGKLPVLAVSGFKKPILAQDALNWLQDNALKALNGGIDACNLDGNFADNCSTIAQAELMGSEFFNTEYNMGFVDGKGETGKGYSNIDEGIENRIMTFDDVSSKKKASVETQARLNAIKAQRDGDVPQALTRIGGGPPGMPMMPQMGGMGQQPMMGGMPMMPQMPGMPGMPGMMPRQMMPQMPGMPGMMNGMPMMPMMPGRR